MPAHQTILDPLATHVHDAVRCARRAATSAMAATLGIGLLALASFFPGLAGAQDLLLDQQAVNNVDPDPALYWLGANSDRAQTFTVGISGTLDFVEVKVSGGATATFEIHPTTNGEPIIGSTPLGSATITFDSPSSTNPVYYPINFTDSAIEVRVGDVLAIVSPGGVNTPTPGNTPFWHQIRSTAPYPGGSLFREDPNDPNLYINQPGSDFGFATYVDTGSAVPGVMEFDRNDRSLRPILLYPESTPCPFTGVDGLPDPGCSRYAGDPDARFDHPPIRADIVDWTGDLATIVAPQSEVARYLHAHLGVSPITNSTLKFVVATNSGILVGGQLEGLLGDYFLTAELPTPQGNLDFTWWNQSQNDRGFEGAALVGTAFEKRVVASCAAEGDAPAPFDTNGICFLQGPASPGYGELYKTITAYAQLDATYPLEDYSPEFEVLDFGLAEAPPPPPTVPGMGNLGRALLAAVLALVVPIRRTMRSIGPGTRRRCAKACVAAALGTTLFTVMPDTALAATYEGVIELGVSESFPTAGATNAPSTERWHRTLRTTTGRLALPSTENQPGFAHESYVRVEGMVSDGVLTPTSIEEISSPVQTFARAAVVPSTDTLGAQRTLVTLLNFTNDLSQPYSVASVRALLIDETQPGSTASYIREAAYDRAWLTGGVAGWIPVGYDDTNCELWWSGGGAATLVDAMDPLIDFSAWDRWLIVIPPNPQCGFVGYSSLGKETWSTDDGVVRFSRIVLNGTNASTPAVAAHELGHSIGGLQHALDYECETETVADNCTPGTTATDRYDVMSSTVDYGHYSAPNKEALHWLDTDLVEVMGTGGTFLLEPFESATPGTKVLRVPVTWNLDDLHAASAYYLSFRTATGFDAIYPELASDGLMVHLDGDFFVPTTPPVVGSSRLLDFSPNVGPTQVADSADTILPVGQTFTDTFHGASFEVLGRIGNALEVQVSLAQTCNNGVVDPNVGEQCDGSDLAGATCSSIGLTSGSLACSVSCVFDVSMCGTPRCGPGHAFDAATQTCSAEFLVDSSERGLWRNLATWTAARNATTANGIVDEYGYLFLSNLEDPTRALIYRLSLPFDTTSIPDGATILSARLSLKGLDASFPTANNAPTGSDQLVLIQPSLANPPAAQLTDFASFGALDSPVEGAPRVDIGDLLTGSDFPFQFDLNAAGLAWVDSTDFTMLGLRSAFDVDDTPPASQDLDFRLYLRGEESPIAGPRLSVTYAAVPEPGVGIGLAMGCIAIVATRPGRGGPSRRTPLNRTTEKACQSDTSTCENASASLSA